MVETLSKLGRPILYEAGCTNKAGKKYEVLVQADGTRQKNERALQQR
jgi:hypothetical protein